MTEAAHRLGRCSICHGFYRLGLSRACPECDPESARQLGLLLSRRSEDTFPDARALADVIVDGRRLTWFGNVVEEIWYRLSGVYWDDVLFVAMMALVGAVLGALLFLIVEQPTTWAALRLR